MTCIPYLMAPLYHCTGCGPLWKATKPPQVPVYFSLCGVLFHFSLPLLVHLICLLVYLFYTWFIFPLSPVFFSNMIFFDRFVFAFLSFTSVFFSCLLTFPDSSLCYITFLVLAFDLSSYFYRFIFYKVLHVYRVYKGRAFKKKG